MLKSVLCVIVFSNKCNVSLTRYKSTYQRITGNVIVVDVFFTIRGLLGLETEVLCRYPHKVCVKLQTSSTDNLTGYQVR